jgi:hypothetical protein
MPARAVHLPACPDEQLEALGELGRVRHAARGFAHRKTRLGPHGIHGSRHRVQVFLQGAHELLAGRGRPRQAVRSVRVAQGLQCGAYGLPVRVVPGQVLQAVVADAQGAGGGVEGADDQSAVATGEPRQAGAIRCARVVDPRLQHGRQQVGVLLLDHRRQEALSDLRTGLATYSALAAEAALVIGVGHMHQDSAHGLDAYYDVLEQRGLRLPVLSVDVRKRSDVLLLLELLIASREARTESAS